MFIGVVTLRSNPTTNHRSIAHLSKFAVPRVECFHDTNLSSRCRCTLRLYLLLGLVGNPGDDLNFAHIQAREETYQNIPSDKASASASCVLPFESCHGVHDTILGLFHVLCHLFSPTGLVFVMFMTLHTHDMSWGQSSYPIQCWLQQHALVFHGP